MSQKTWYKLEVGRNIWTNKKVVGFEKVVGIHFQTKQAGFYVSLGNVKVVGIYFQRKHAEFYVSFK